MSTLGVIQFLVCCLIAIWLYPGGTMVDETTMGFSATGNYLSDLGRDVSFSGQDNRLGSAFFNWSLTILGFSILPFFFFMPTQAVDRFGWLIATGILGGLSALALVVMGLSPINLYPMQHVLALLFWMFTLFWASIVHGMAMLTSKVNPTWLSLLSIFVSVIAIWYMYFGMQTAMAVWFEQEIPLQAALLQKFLVILSMIWILSFSVKMLLTTDFSEFYKRKDTETEQYVSDLEQQLRT